MSATVAASAPVPRQGLRERIGESRRLQALIIGVPVFAWIFWWLGGSYAVLLVQSFFKVEGFFIVPKLNVDNYVEIATKGFYLTTLLKSFGIAAVTVVISTSLAFPVAYFLAYKVRTRRAFGYFLVIVPLWVSYLVRAYAWKVVLGEQGALNGVLTGLGIIHEPISFLLYSPVAVIIALTHIYTPFMILTIYAVLEQIPQSFTEAARDLGANGFRAFVGVTLPLAMPGIMAGGLFSFGLAAGDFVAPILVGGADGVMIANIIASQFGASNNWPLGAALAVCMLGLMVVVIRFASWFESRSLTT
jgi:spermidine/putrescine transport system permease protein